jgi:hypothetical protein
VEADALAVELNDGGAADETRQLSRGVGEKGPAPRSCDARIGDGQRWEGDALDLLVHLPLL